MEDSGNRQLSGSAPHAWGARDCHRDRAYTHVVVDENESPLVWLARRRGRDGRVMIETHQLQAGERLRADFRRAHLMPRTSSNWSNPIPSRRRASGRQAAPLTETIIAARQRVHHALDAVGLEFSGLLLDVCCFLKGLEDVERERVWPALGKNCDSACARSPSPSLRLRSQHKRPNARECAHLACERCSFQRG
ncbi:MAG: DUF6456 domain-containing protein [Sphingobacteriales bacterium]